MTSRRAAVKLLSLPGGASARGGSLLETWAGHGTARSLPQQCSTTGRSLLSSGAHAGGLMMRAYAAQAAAGGGAGLAAASTSGWTRRLIRSLMGRNHEFNRAVASGMTLSTPGERIIASFMPVALWAFLYPNRFRALAYDATAAQRATLENPSLAASLRRRLLGSVGSGAAARWPLAWLADELVLAARAAYLMLLFLPAIIAAPFVFGLQIGRQWWMDMLRDTLERAGPAFIKWGQWSATRPDLFPPDLCQALERLQAGAPAHAGQVSLQYVREAFGQPVEHLFDTFETTPVASGSIAQIHRATLSAAGAAATGQKPGTVVAVKVRHPGVTTLMTRDFALMQRAAWAASRLPGLSELRLEESIRQFGAPLKEQLDLTVEAKHLGRFKHNFRLCREVSFPTPLHPLVAPAVLVESFEEGGLINKYVHNPTYVHKTKLAQMGMNLYLQMLLKDNFIHADLHPGNILVREPPAAPATGCRGEHARGLRGFVTRLIGTDLWRADAAPKLVLLDTGMTAELTPDDQRSLIGFFRSLTQKDGEGMASNILAMSEMHTCKDPEAFVTAMRDMFDSLDPETIRVRTGDVFADMIETLRQHQVTLKSAVSTVVVTTLVLEGWSSKLDPDLHIVESMREMLGSAAWADRISATVDKVMGSGQLAVA